MKQEYYEEFDLDAIYKKLTAPSKPMMIKASEFFRPRKSMLAQFQEQMEVCFANAAPIVYPAVADERI